MNRVWRGRVRDRVSRARMGARIVAPHFSLGEPFASNFSPNLVTLSVAPLLELLRFYTAMFLAATP
jgi:hypothetical protein